MEDVPVEQEAPTRLHPFIETWSGDRFYYGNPKTNVNLNDIIAQLAHSNRFAGATVAPYPIAQHAVEVCQILQGWGCDALTQMYGLHHDDHEYVMGDPPTPYQIWMTELNGGYDILGVAKAYLDNIIMPKLGLPWPAQTGIWDLVKQADSAAFVNEARQLFITPPDWIDEYSGRKKVREVHRPISIMKPFDAAMSFLGEHERLRQILQEGL